MGRILLSIGFLFLICRLSLEGQLVRQANSTLNLPAELATSSGYVLENAFGTLTFNNAICLANPPGETNRLFVVQRVGQIVIVNNLSTTPVKLTPVFLDLSTIPGLVVPDVSRLTTESECGFLSMAFHPNYASNGYFFIFYSFEVNTGTVETPDWRRFQRVARCKVSATNPNLADPASHTPLITQYDEAPNHNGGDMAFGSDGYLYISVGDEGIGNDFYDNARYINKDFFGAILRIDVDSKTTSLAPNAHAQTVPGNNPFPSAINPGTYKIPADNPFIGTTSWHNQTIAANTVRTEIYATGLRNPWRFSIDPVSNRLFCGDVGQATREEIDIITKGGDYGWSWLEGNTTFNSAPAPKTPPTTGFNPIAPIFDYPRTLGYSVTGGQIWRSPRLPELSGTYVFADFGSGRIWSLAENAGTWTPTVIATDPNIVEIGINPLNQDTLFCKLGGNPIFRLVRSYTGTTPPATLSATGAFSNVSTLTPNTGLVAYDPNVPFWSDYALKQRWFALKNTTDTIGFSPTGNWTLPTGMVWVKHFDIETKRGDSTTKRKLETRFIVKTATDVYGITYRWRADQTNADLVEEDGLNEPLTINVNGTATTQTWHYPSRGECRSCHTAQGGYALSFNTHQLNRSHIYGSQTPNQIAALSDAGYLSQPVGTVNNLPAFAAASDTTQSLEWRVRSYLAVNCVSCHQPGGSGLGNWDARITTATDSANLINGLLNDSGDSGSNRFAVPGDLTHSMLFKRLQGVTAGRMPPIASNEIDPAAIQLVSDWITQSLPGRQTFVQWQAAQFANPTAPSAAATADYDGDGASNELEYLTRTNPKVASDQWKFDTITAGNGPLQINYTQPANRASLIETSADLKTWTLLDATGNSATYPNLAQPRTLLDPQSGAQKFYRIRFAQP